MQYNSFTSIPENVWDAIASIRNTVLTFLTTMPGKKVLLTQSFAHAKPIDEIILTIIPQILEKGIALGLNFNAFSLAQEKMLDHAFVSKALI